MLGIALRLVHEPNTYGSQPYYATVESEAGLQVAALMTPPYKLQIYAEEDHDRAGLGLVAEALLRGRWPVPGVMAHQAVAEAFAAHLARQDGRKLPDRDAAADLRVTSSCAARLSARRVQAGGGGGYRAGPAMGPRFLRRLFRRRAL